MMLVAAGASVLSGVAGFFCSGRRRSVGVPVLELQSHLQVQGKEPRRLQVQGGALRRHVQVQAQACKRKFNTTKNPTASRMFHNMWYSFWGVVQWTKWEACFITAYASGRLPYVSDEEAFSTP